MMECDKCVLGVMNEGVVEGMSGVDVCACVCVLVVINEFMINDKCVLSSCCNE